jgi:hypothetical protein
VLGKFKYRAARSVIGVLTAIQRDRAVCGANIATRYCSFVDPYMDAVAAGPAVALQAKTATLPLPGRGWSLLTLGSLVGSAAGAVYLPPTNIV